MNKTMSRSDMSMLAGLITSLEQLMVRMRMSGLNYTDWCGRLDFPVRETVANLGPSYVPVGLVDEWRIPWYTYWEYCWVLHNSEVLAGGQRVLDLGGAASVFDSLIGICGNELVILDRGKHGRLAEKNAKALNYNLTYIQGDIKDGAKLLKGQEFDQVVSISNLFLCGKPARQSAMRYLKDVVRSGGRLSFSFDFANPNPKRHTTDPEAFFSPEEFVIRGEPFRDNGERYHVYYPDGKGVQYTSGALFYERT